MGLGLAKSEFRESTKQVLLPAQVADMTEERNRLRRMLEAPAYVRQMVADPSAAVKQMRKIDQMLDTQAPKPYEGAELDAAVKRERELREKFSAGMPTAAEMRRAPPGARDKHMNWEKRNKRDVLEWKTIRRRLHASGALPQYHEMSSDVSNIEQYRRQSGGAQELSFERAQIKHKEMHGIDTAQVGVAVFSDDDLQTLRAIDPEIAELLPTLDNEKRAKVRDFIRGLDKPAPEPVATVEKSGEPLTGGEQISLD